MRPIDGLLIDIDGVLVVTWEPIAGAAEALGRLRAAQVPIRFATNTTSRTRPQIADALTEVGMPVEPDEILTATVATASYLRAHHPGARCLVLNEGDLTEDLAGIEMTTGAPADVVVIGDDVVSDVLGAQEAGMTGVLVKTGKFRPESLEGLDTGPDLIVDSFADVPAALDLGPDERRIRGR